MLASMQLLVRRPLGPIAALALALGACSPTPTRPPVDDVTHAPTFAWSSWERAAFDRAERDGKIILINVVAQWCHWCHVMDETTYADPEVAALLAEHFVTIRVDSDARPDLAERYRRWGWPATAVLTPSAEPVLELRGYRDPRVFAELLRELIRERDEGRLVRRERPGIDDQPLDREPASDLLAAQQRWLGVLDGFYDVEQHGWGDKQKYPWPVHVELALVRAHAGGQPIWRERALSTLAAERSLIDPVWGGMYQYSVGGVWTRPHFEKIAMIQAGAIENFVHAAQITGDPSWRANALQIADYLLDHMQDPHGGFWTSQDADLRPDQHGQGEVVLGIDYYALADEQRRALGIPRTDTQVYADLNGQIIHALTELYRIDPDPRLRDAAIRAGERLVQTHLRASGGFAHGEADQGLLHLSDQVAMGWALLGLHRITWDPRWLEHAITTAEFVQRELAAPEGGYYAHQADPDAVGVFAQRRMPPEENALAAIFMLELHRLLDGDGSKPTPWRERAELALRASGSEERLAPEGKVIARWLLAIELLRHEGVDVTVVGEVGDPRADALWQAALAVWEPRATLERSRPGERYPASGSPAVYLCTSSACSSPVREPAQLAAQAERFLTEHLPAKGG